MSNFARVSVDPETGQSVIGGAAPTGNYGLSPEQVAQHRAAAQVVSNPTKFSSAGTDVGTYRVNTAPEADEARTSSGAPVGTRQLRDNDRVTIDGVEVRVKEARRLGWIEEDATGNRPFVRG